MERHVAFIVIWQGSNIVLTEIHDMRLEGNRQLEGKYKLIPYTIIVRLLQSILTVTQSFLKISNKNKVVVS